MRRVRYDLTWRPAHVAALLAAWAVGAAVLGWRWVDRPIRFASALPVLPNRIAAVTEKVNPNTAPVGSLRRLSGIGPVRAAAIAEYAAAHGPAAFRRPEDLTAVSGIGPGTVERLRPYLVFPPSDN
jgi:competence protein ComEA